ncbi:MAG TPA: DNA (cytosine-5-)-methyltransferase [Candidatus Paceibacterota bacterium]
MTRSLNHTTRKKVLQRRPLRVVELFAGVGGFRLGLSGTNRTNSKNFETVWFNQWEPSTKRQHAHEVYVARFPNDKNEIREHSNTNIAEAVRAAQRGDFKIPDHDVLVGGFPCQDYSVARTLSQAAGIAGKKGVLWWEIRNILELKQKEGKPVPYLFLENVDRLLKSPASQRGRDFAVMLTTLSDLGYAVEWRVINAADYGMPQRRRRTFIVGYHMSSPLYETMGAIDPHHVLMKKGVLASAFPVSPKSASVDVGSLIGNYADISERFNSENPSASPFHSAGIMSGRQFHTIPVLASYDGSHITLGNIILKERDVPEEYFVNGDMRRWEYLKGGKNEPRKGANGFEFTYTEGPMVFPDPLNKPSRTIVTGEGGKTPSRFKHVIKMRSGKLRRLTPVELERLCMFPDDHTDLPGISDVRRAFFMGNALVVGVIDRIGKALVRLHKHSIEHGVDALQNPTPSPLGPKAASPNSKRAPATLF